MITIEDPVAVIVPHAVVDVLAERVADRAKLRRPVYFEGRAEGLHGVVGARSPFPVIDDADDGRWIRWAGKMLDDQRNTGHTTALSTTTKTINLGRTALGDQAGLVDGTRRWLVQTKTTCDPAAPAQAARAGGGGGDG